MEHYRCSYLSLRWGQGELPGRGRPELQGNQNSQAVWVSEAQKAHQQEGQAIWDVLRALEADAGV